MVRPLLLLLLVRWAPVPALGSVLFTPAFNGTLRLGGERKVQLDATAQWPRPIQLLPGLLELQEYVAAGKAPADSPRGPSLDFWLVQDNTTNATVEYALNLSGCAVLQLPAAPSEPPALDMIGQLRSDAESTLMVSFGGCPTAF